MDLSVIDVSQLKELHFTREHLDRLEECLHSGSQIICWDTNVPGCENNRMYLLNEFEIQGIKFITILSKCSYFDPTQLRVVTRFDVNTITDTSLFEEYLTKEENV